MKKIINSLLIITLLASLITLTACTGSAGSGESQPDSTEKKLITDILGREVEIPGSVSKVAVTGVGALRLYAYSADLEKLAGVEAVEHEDAPGRPYTQINQELFRSLPAIGQGGPNGGNDPEKILAVSPDVIFTTYENPDELQSTLGIPVIAIGYGANGLFDEQVYQSLNIIGEVMGTQEKAETAVSYMQSCEKDLKERTENIETEGRAQAYVGALGSKGAKGIESTRGGFVIFDSLNVDNVADETGKTGSLMIDKEQLLVWDPEFIFLDLDGLVHVKEDYRNNKEFYGSLSAFRDHKVYGQLPYNFLTTNIDTAMVNAYFTGKTLYPEAFADLDPEEKADEIYETLLGKPFYQQMKDTFGGFGPLESLD